MLKLEQKMHLETTTYPMLQQVCKHIKDWPDLHLVHISKTPFAYSENELHICKGLIHLGHWKIPLTSSEQDI